MRRIALLMAAVVGAGCGLLPPAPPDWVSDRAPLASCGTETAGRGEGINEGARRCLLEAYRAGRGAELVSTVTTVEGDPIVRYIRVHPDGSVEIFADATQDRHGPGEWQRYECARIVPVGESAHPPDVDVPERTVFVEEGCRPMMPV